MFSADHCLSFHSKLHVLIFQGVGHSKGPPCVDSEGVAAHNQPRGPTIFPGFRFGLLLLLLHTIVAVLWSWSILLLMQKLEFFATVINQYKISEYQNMFYTLVLETVQMINSYGQ